MHTDIPVMVVGGSGGGVSEGILKALRMAGYQNITLLEHDRNNAHVYRVDNVFLIEENPDTGNYVEQVLEYCLEHGIKVIIPGSTWEAKAYSGNRELLLDHAIIPLVNNSDLINICNEKWKSYQFLTEQGIDAPQTHLRGQIDADEIEFPVIVKPNIGRGSRHIYLVKSKDEFHYVTGYLTVKNIQYVIQAYIHADDEEYTVGVVSDKAGTVIDSIVMKRHLSEGYTHHAWVQDYSYINEFCEHVAARLHSTGPINVQLRLDPSGRPMIFEINPRFSGSAPMRALAGFNEVDMILRNFVFGEALQRIDIVKTLEFFRVFQEIYFDRTQNNPTAVVKNYV